MTQRHRIIRTIATSTVAVFLIAGVAFASEALRAAPGADDPAEVSATPTDEATSGADGDARADGDG